MTKPKTAIDSSGNLIVTLDREYRFQAPKGRHLAAIQRSLNSDMVSVESAAVTISTLSLDGLTYDQILDFDGGILLDLEAAIAKSFRVFNLRTV